MSLPPPTPPYGTTGDPAAALAARVAAIEALLVAGVSVIADGSIVNADVNAAAAIAYSKLNLAGSITSNDITDGTIATGDLVASAATKLWYGSTGSVTNSVTTSVLIATVTTSDWAGTGTGFAIWTPYFVHSTIDAVVSLSYSVDAGGLTNMATAQAPRANDAIPFAGVIPLIGIGAGSRDHKFWFTTNTATSWTVANGYIVIVELRN